MSDDGVLWKRGEKLKSPLIVLLVNFLLPLIMKEPYGMMQKRVSPKRRNLIALVREEASDIHVFTLCFNTI